MAPFLSPLNSPGLPATGTRGAEPGRAHAAPAEPRGAHGTPAADVRPGAAAKAKPAFAQVLAEAQHDAGADPSEPAAIPGQRRVAAEGEPPVDAREPDGPTDVPLVSIVVPVEEPRTVAASSWLLLALAQGPAGPTEQAPVVESAVTAGAGGGVSLDGVASAAMLSGAAMPVATADVGAAPQAAPTAASVVVDRADITPAGAELGPSGEAGAANVPAFPIPAVPTSDTPVDPLRVQAALVVEQAPQAPAAGATLPAERPAPEAIARWRAAARTLSAATTPQEPVSDASAAAGPVAGRPPGPSPIGVTTTPGPMMTTPPHPVARVQGAGEAGRLEWSASPDAAGGPGLGRAGATPGTARAGEVLPRLAGGGDVPDRGRDAAASAPAVTVAMAPPAPTAAAAPAPSVVMPALPPAVAEQVMTHLVSSLKMQWKDGIGEAKLHLRPDAYGSMTVALRVEHGAVTAVVRSDSAQVQDWVLQHQQSLREQMEAAGLRLDELSVAPDDRGQQSHQEEPPDGQRRRARRGKDEDADAPVFELLA